MRRSSYNIPASQLKVEIGRLPLLVQLRPARDSDSQERNVPLPMLCWSRVAMRTRMIWQLKSIQQAASHYELCKAENRECIGYLLADEQTQSRLPCK